ncbi:MAG: cupin [Gammaproteobacteria bacterium]|nr:cupin [Gammaproteobacteria bacterium]
MDEQAFRQMLSQNGYPEPVSVEWDSGNFTGQHTHDFDARGLVLSGRFTLSTEAGATNHGPGDTFALDAGLPHSERTYDEKVCLLIGRAPR